MTADPNLPSDELGDDRMVSRGFWRSIAAIALVAVGVVAFTLWPVKSTIVPGSGAPATAPAQPPSASIVAPKGTAFRDVAAVAGVDFKHESGARGNKLLPECLGGGVATQTSGQVLGVGPTRIEVNANFEPGNSGSPIFSTSTKEVVGVATYAETRKVAVEETAAPSRYGEAGPVPSTKVEKRWFGYRLDSVTKWEAIDLAKWHAQGERVEKFKDVSEALVAVIRFNFKKAVVNERLAPIIADFQTKAAQKGTNQMGVAGEVKSLFYNIRSLAETGLRDFETAEYYDYYRTCLYWEESVPMQVDYRKAIIEVLKKYEANSGNYVSRMRNGG